MSIAFDVAVVVCATQNDYKFVQMNNTSQCGQKSTESNREKQMQTHERIEMKQF